MTEKMWGDAPYFGLGYEWDPRWFLNPEQRALEEALIALCAKTIRPNAVEFDKTKEWPAKSLKAMHDELGLLGLIIPKEFGGLGQNHRCMVNVLETIGRYGCPSTCLVYTMHLIACSAVLFRAKGNPFLEDLLRRICRDGLVGTAAYSDPETGSHFWFPIASGSEPTETGWRVNKKGSWVTSGGFADFYVAQTTSHDYGGDYSKLSVFVLFKDEIRSNPALWNAMGMRGNQSGPVDIANVEIPKDRMVGWPGDGAMSNDEGLDPFGFIMFAGSYNGMSMAMIDLAKQQTTRKTHSDVGMRVADYPTIQDYVGDCLMDTTASRVYAYEVARVFDEETNDCDWSLHWNNPGEYYRAKYYQWTWMTKYLACKNVYTVGNRMLQACGGTGFKTELGLERIFRDSRAGWLMGPTNEVLRQFIGKGALLGLGSLDWWQQGVDERKLENELKKLDAQGKKALIARLQADLDKRAAE